VQDIFCALGGCDPENLDDLADSLDMLIDEDDPHRPEWYLLCKLSEEKFMALQLASTLLMAVILQITNNGPLIVSSNYWQSDMAQAGYLYLISSRCFIAARSL
jgi:hypothetical protein